MAKIKYEITNERNSKKFIAIEESRDWLEKQIEKGTFGKPARWIPLEKADDFEKSREDDRREVRGEKNFPAVEGEYLYDKDGNIAQTLVEPVEAYVDEDALLGYEIHVPADYVIVETDVTQELADKEANEAAKKLKKSNALKDLEKVKIDNLDLDGVKDVLKKLVHILEIDEK